MNAIVTTFPFWKLCPKGGEKYKGIIFSCLKVCDMEELDHNILILNLYFFWCVQFLWLSYDQQHVWASMKGFSFLRAWRHYLII